MSDFISNRERSSLQKSGFELKFVEVFFFIIISALRYFRIA